MTFSEFAKILYTYCNEGESEPAFVIHLVDKIMDGQPGREYGDGLFQNPMRNISQRTLLNYLNGDRWISRKDASAIYSRIKTEKFEKYIEKRCSAEAKLLLLDDLLEIEDLEDMGKNQTVPEICARLFEKILRSLANPMA